MKIKLSKNTGGLKNTFPLTQSLAESLQNQSENVLTIKQLKNSYQSNGGTGNTVKMAKLSGKKIGVVNPYN